MDGFDDLLSRSALEANPFADPFAARSPSPDPWATPFASSTQTESAFGSSDHFASDDTYGSGLYTPTSTGFEDAKPPASPPLKLQETSDDDDDDQPLGAKLRSPGFRESVQPFSETETIRPEHIEEPFKTTTVNEPEPPAPAPSAVITTTPASPPLAVDTDHTGTIESTPSFDSAITSGPGSRLVVSPLDGSPNLTQSFSGLGIGGRDQFADGWGSSTTTTHAHIEPTPWQPDPDMLPIVKPAQPPPPPAQHPDISLEDSDDDLPIAQRLRNRDAENGADAKPRQDVNSIQPVFVITVDDPQKVGDPIRGYTMYTVHTRTTSPNFLKSAFSVLRRYSDFVWLYDTLSYNNPGVVVPPLPEKNTFNRFDDQFVKQRRSALEKCIQKTANHPILGKDPDLRLFLESDTFSLDIKHRKSDHQHERGGLLSSIGQTFTGPRFHETDEWFDRQRIYLDGLEAQLRSLVKAIELVAKHRNELAVATGDFAANVGELASSDVGRQLSQSLNGLVEVERKAQDLQTQQAEQDITTLTSTADEYARLVNSVRMAFASRIRVYHAWKTAEAECVRIKQNHERNRAQGKVPTERLGFSLSLIADAERRATEAKNEYEGASKLAKTEVARFERERIEDFKDSLHAFLEGMISRQKEIIATWENYQQALLKRGQVANDSSS